MPRPDTGTFNRLLTSLGLLFLAAALVIPYFYFRNTGTLEIEKNTLRHLTNPAREAIEDRQAEIATIQPFVLPTAGALVLLGFGLLIWGGYRLREAQDRDDREAEARTIIAEAGVRDLTPQEKEDKIERDATPEPADDEAGGDTPPPPPSAPTEASPPPAKASDRRRHERDERLATVRRIDASATAVLSASEFEGYRFRAQVAVGRLKLDGLFLALSDRAPDILLEIRVAPRITVPLQADRILAAVPRYEFERQRPCRPWLVTVMPEDPDLPVDIARRMREASLRLNDSLSPVGLATVIQENEIERLPAIFSNVIRPRFDPLESD